MSFADTEVSEHSLMLALYVPIWEVTKNE